jgi:hypothetical protein
VNQGVISPKRAAKTNINS